MCSRILVIVAYQSLCVPSGSGKMISQPWQPTITNRQHGNDSWRGQLARARTSQIGGCRPSRGLGWPSTSGDGDRPYRCGICVMGQRGSMVRRCGRTGLEGGRNGLLPTLTKHYLEILNFFCIFL